jgi:predicted transcriptional regulator
MLAKHLISELIIPLRTSDTGADALGRMDDYRLSHLPIVNNEEFLGLLSDEDIYVMDDYDEALGGYNLSLTAVHVTQDQHIFDVIKQFAELKLSLVPVLDHKNKYLGSITISQLVENFSKIAAIENPGGVIVLEVSQNDYMLSEISQIIESNDAKVLSLCVVSDPDSTKLEITIKINKIDIQAILQTFSRYNYLVKASFTKTDDIEDLKDRYDSLMNYLNI